jgi:energy-coupling factor transport system substrate-specific component
MRMSRTTMMVFSALGIGINILGGTLAQVLKIPLLFLDTIGTVLVAVLCGPWWAAAAGTLTNVIQGMITSPKDIFFFIVNLVIGLIVGFIARKYDFRKWYVAAGTGVILSIVAPLIGTPIAVAVYGGLNGSGTDLLVLWLRATGADMFTSTFLSRIASNLVDKIGTCLLIMVIIRLAFFEKKYEAALGERSIGS